MRRLLQPGLAALLGIAILSFPVHAATIYTTTLSGANEVPPTGSPGSGSVTIMLNGNILDVSIAFSGLTTDDTAAHIHCCMPLGVDAGVALPFTTFPLGVTSGTFTAMYDLTDPAVYEATFLDGGTAAQAEAALIAGLNDGMAYVNIHTTTDPGGEIRGQLAAVPEPSTLLLGATILAAVILLKRR